MNFWSLMLSIILTKYEKTKTKNGIESDKKRRQKARFPKSLGLKEFELFMRKFL